MRRHVSKKAYIFALSLILILLNAIVWPDKGEASAAMATDIRKVTLQKIYMDGEMTEETTVKEAQSVESIMEKYRAWKLVYESEKELVFQKYIDDISPLMKAHGYFGVTEDGILTIFNGKPTKLDVIQTFFQLDVDLLEVKRREELAEGIRVKDKKRYQSVLETFKPYKNEGLR
ncbi:BofC C-terminal domain-containing protein [Bacillus testis]|uniref:BofC C-terminal domain-containing protein n=1 Tax=Bacillus testis TaxID=1622072 RepID=UPI00067F4099|nr:BofC C-terminal domain-containing protein [Bacillus testis]